jgi:hypothetical protein
VDDILTTRILKYHGRSARFLDQARQRHPTLAKLTEGYPG